MSLKHSRKAPHQKPVHGNKPEPARRYSGNTIMSFAGKQGFLDVRRSRKLAGYRHGTASKYEPHAGARGRNDAQ